MNYKAHLNTGLIAIIAVIVCTLLIGAMYGFTWAGGEGRIDRAIITSDDATFVEQQEIASGDAFKKLEIVHSKTDEELGTIYLDKNTRIQFVNTDSAQLSLRIIEGRMVVDTNAGMRVLAADMTLEGSGIIGTTFYGWLNKADYFAQSEASVTVANSEYQKTLRDEALSVTTGGESVIEEQIEFNPSESTAADFYQWTGLQF